MTSLRVLVLIAEIIHGKLFLGKYLTYTIPKAVVLQCGTWPYEFGLPIFGQVLELKLFLGLG